MDTINKEKLVFALIKDDLINNCLIRELERIGLYSECYYLHLSSTIFELMGFENYKETDELYDKYIELTEKAGSIDITRSNKPLEHLAVEIYKGLKGYQR